MSSQVMNAWHHHIMRKTKVTKVLREKNRVQRWRMQTHAFHGWHFAQSQNKFLDQEMERLDKDRLEFLWKEWRLIARVLKTRRRRTAFLHWRMIYGLKDRFFQLWGDGVEGEIIKKIKIDKMRSQSRIFILSFKFARWAQTAYVTEKGVGNFKVRRIFKSLKRYVRIQKQERRVSAQWNTVNQTLAVHDTFGRWQKYLHDVQLGASKLCAICVAQGALDLSTCFQRWRDVESRHRLWRYQRNHIQRRRRSSLKIEYFKLWLLNGIGKETFDGDF